MKFILTNLIIYLTQPTYKIDTWVDSHPHINNMHNKIVSRYRLQVSFDPHEP
jgi:hypothetical protein